MTPGTGWQPSDEFLDRVKRAYRLSIEGWHGPGRSMWTGIFERQRPVHEALLDDDPAALRAILSDPGSTDIFYGVDNLCAVFIAKHGRIDLPSMADNEETGQLLRFCARLVGDDGGDPISALDRALEQTIEFPNPFRGEYGVQTKRGVATYRAIHALYQTHRIRRVINGHARVLEIGPGAGRTAYYAFKSGIDYTTLDLPLGVVAQACFLGATLGEDRLWLIGDHPDSADGKIRLLPVSLGLPDEHFDLVVNVDSMTEMDAADALRNARWIAEHASSFLSINHDLNDFTVDELCRAAFGSRSKHQSDYPMRPGYSEVVFVPGRAIPEWLASAMLAIIMLRRRVEKRVSSIRARCSWRQARVQYGTAPSRRQGYQSSHS